MEKEKRLPLEDVSECKESIRICNRTIVKQEMELINNIKTRAVTI